MQAVAGFYICGVQVKLKFVRVWVLWHPSWFEARPGTDERELRQSQPAVQVGTSRLWVILQGACWMRSL